MSKTIRSPQIQMKEGGEMENKSDLEERLKKLEKSAGFLKTEEKIVNFCLALLSVAMSIFVIGTLIVFAVKMLSG